MNPTLFALDPLVTAPPTIPGLHYEPGYLSAWEQCALLDAVDAAPWNASMSRRIQGYGQSYKRASGSVTRPMPEWALTIARRLLDDGLVGRLCDQLLVNEYLPGQGIAAHVDYADFDRTVVSISLGSACVMDLVHGETGEHHGLLLEPGSVLVLQDEARYRWTHGIAKRKNDVWNGQKFARGRRVSLTYRNIISPRP